MGDGFVLMQLGTLESLPEVPSLHTQTRATAGQIFGEKCNSAVKAQHSDLAVRLGLDEPEPEPEPSIVLGWSRCIESSRADFVRLHREVGDEVGQDPDVFDSTFGSDAERLSKRMAFLYDNAAISVDQGATEPEPLAVGTCTAWEVGGTGWIHSLAVGAEYQGRGLSKLLLGAALHRLRELGHSSAMLAVRPTSRRAITLYQHWGFKPVLEDQEDRTQWAAASVAAAVDSVGNLALKPHPDEYGARVQHLIRVPHCLGDRNSRFALCGPAAVLYAALVQSAQDAVVALLRRVFSTSYVGAQNQGSAQSLVQHDGASAAVQRYRNQMKLKPAMTDLGQSDPIQSREAELDFILCRGLVGVMEEGEPMLFVEQVTYLSTQFPAEHGFNVEHGDLGLLPGGMEGLLRALHGDNAESLRWRTVTQDSLRTPEEVLAQLQAAATMPSVVILAGRRGAEDQPDLDHWFVVHELDLPSAGDALGGRVWNYAGHAGDPFEIAVGSTDSFASGWFDLGFHTLIILSSE